MEPPTIAVTSHTQVSVSTAETKIPISMVTLPSGSNNGKTYSSGQKKLPVFNS